MSPFCSARHLRAIGLDPFSDERGTHTVINETIDRTVFERWRLNPTYRPNNLSQWASRKRINPADIDGSVLAAEPHRHALIDR